MNLRKFILIGDQFGEGEAIGRGNRKVRGIEGKGNSLGERWMGGHTLI